MLSIRTNLTSLLAQSSLRTSSNKLNQAIERMTTGFKINNAKDNAANYSISTNLSTKIGAYQVAEENTAMGLDMVTIASETLSLIEDKLSRARALCVQAQNGTYGQQSLDAIKSELGAIVDELVRTKENAQYNDINLFGKEEMPVANPETGFIADVVVQNPEVTVSDPAQLLDAIENNSIIGISNAETLAQLATIVNNDLHNCEGKTIVLTEDIDLSGYSNWTPIGWYDSTDKEHHVFKGDFNGNGHTISNLKITSSVHSGVGLFGFTFGSTISNVGLIGVDITSNQQFTAGLGGRNESNNLISNCYVDGSVNVTAEVSHSGLLFASSHGRAINCYTTGSIVSNGFIVGGLAGNGILENCFSTANVTAAYNVGGLQGFSEGAKNCYATGDVTATVTSGVYGSGGLIGTINNPNFSPIENCYATGNVTGINYVGGCVGRIITTNYTAKELLINTYSTGVVTGSGYSVGDFIGRYGVNIDSLSGCITEDELNLYLKNGILDSDEKGTSANLQVGISDDLYSSIGLDFGLTTSEILAIKNSPTSAYSLATIDYMLSKVTTKQTELGAAENRLTSALEEIGIKYENLVSTRSTIRDADISEVSSQYIQQQILQQASSTLLATANQSPDLALRLIMNSTI